MTAEGVTLHSRVAGVTPAVSGTVRHCVQRVICARCRRPVPATVHGRVRGWPRWRRLRAEEPAVVAVAGETAVLATAAAAVCRTLPGAPAAGTATGAGRVGGVERGLAEGLPQTELQRAGFAAGVCAEAVVAADPARGARRACGLASPPPAALCAGAGPVAADHLAGVDAVADVAGVAPGDARLAAAPDRGEESTVIREAGHLGAGSLPVLETLTRVAVLLPHVARGAVHAGPLLHRLRLQLLRVCAGAIWSPSIIKLRQRQRLRFPRFSSVDGVRLGLLVFGLWQRQRLEVTLTGPRVLRVSGGALDECAAGHAVLQAEAGVAAVVGHPGGAGTAGRVGSVRGRHAAGDSPQQTQQPQTGHGCRKTPLLLMMVVMLLPALTVDHCGHTVPTRLYTVIPASLYTAISGDNNDALVRPFFMARSVHPARGRPSRSMGPAG